jgi:hypothetical protein
MVDGDMAPRIRNLGTRIIFTPSGRLCPGGNITYLLDITLSPEPDWVFLEHDNLFSCKQS